MRRGMIPRATDIWTLSSQAPKSYVLNPGGDATRGQRHYKQSCGGCHGGDGTRIKIDRVYSLGAFGRVKAYEAWFKIMVGHPGSVMKAQPPAGSSRKESTAFILDVLAGLCDRGRFPALKGGKDIEEGDLRCNKYLK